MLKLCCSSLKATYILQNWKIKKKKKDISEGSCFMSAAKAQKEFSRDNISESEKHMQAPLTLGKKIATTALLIIVK